MLSLACSFTFRANIFNNYFLHRQAGTKACPRARSSKLKGRHFRQSIRASRQWSAKAVFGPAKPWNEAGSFSGRNSGRASVQQRIENKIRGFVTYKRGERRVQSENMSIQNPSLEPQADGVYEKRVAATNISKWVELHVQRMCATRREPVLLNTNKSHHSTDGDPTYHKNSITQIDVESRSRWVRCILLLVILSPNRCCSVS
jgi:hypothetical protein